MGILSHSDSVASESSRIERLGNALIDGVIQANYREIPLNEILPLTHLAIPKIYRTQSIGHPALLFRQSEAMRIRDRQFRTPYSDWADQILRSADTNHRDPSSPLLTEYERSSMAKRSAFAYFLTGSESNLQDAATALSHISEPDPVRSIEGGTYSTGWGDWMQAADALAQYAVTLDLLYEHLSSSQIASIERKLVSQANQIHRYLILVPKNNHAAAIGAGLGTFALVTSHARAQMWLDTALDLIRAALSQIEPDGSYREGAYYARFVASRIFPFFHYLQNTSNINLFAHKRVGRLVRWLADLEHADGSVPDFDDAFPERFLFLPIGVGSLDESGEVRARFELHADRYNPSDPNWIETYCGFDDHVLSITPNRNGAVFYPHGGMAIFRKDSDLYGLFLGEPGRPFLSGHDHAEPLAFTLQAFGQKFLIDAGYGRQGVKSNNRAWFVSGEAHNIPLINGQGPNLNPLVRDESGGQLLDYFETPVISNASVLAEYRASRFHRQVRFVGQRYFVVSDRIDADPNAHVTLPWHGLGTCEQVESNSVIWRSDQAALEAEFLHPDEPPFISLQEGLHTLPDQEGIHTAATVTFSQEATRKMMTVFLPQKPGEDELESISFPVHSDSPAQARQIVSIQKGWTDYLITAEGAWECSELASDADEAVFRPMQMDEGFFSGTHLTFLNINGEKVFQSDIPVDLTLIFDPAGWYGFLDVAQSGLLIQDSIKVFLTLPTDPGIVLLNKKDAPYQWNEGVLSFSFLQGGILEMGVLSGRVRTDEAIYENLPILTRLGNLHDPDPIIQNLSQDELTQLRNEIVQVMGQSAIHATDQKLGSSGRTADLYGVTSGIMNSVFNQTGKPGFNLPQQFSWTEDMGGHSVRYDEEGEFRDGQFNARRHRVAVEDQLWLMHENLFDSHHLTTVEVNHSNYNVQGTVEQWKDDHSAQMRLTRMQENGRTWVDISGNKETGHKAGMIGFVTSHWSGETAFSRSDSQTPLAMRTQGMFRSARFASTLRIITEEIVGLTSLNWSQSWRALSQLLIHTTLDKSWNKQENPAQFSSSLFWSSKSLYASVQSRWDEQSSPSGFCSGVYYVDKWRFESHGRYGTILSGDFAVSHRSRKLSWETRILQGKRGSVQTSWHVSPAWSTLFRLCGSIRNSELEEKAFGLYYRRISRIGGEIRFTEEDGESLTGITGVAGFGLGQRERLILYTTGLWDRFGIWHAYEIILRQSGRLVTPGILINGDARGRVRCEGHLLWQF
ncbi:heparinase II/III family protein [candidate division KSB1 bacterium]|nr:heparinase II/III family protein [candidate division KSB1 bacterium]